MIFGGYSLYLQKMGILDVAGILESQGQSAAVAAILQTLPLPKLIMIAVCVLCFIYLATTIDSCAYVLAGTTTKSIGRKEEPARWNRICWALIFCAVFGWINDYRRASGYSVGFDNCCTAVNRRNVFIDIVSYKNVKGKRRIENI